MCHDIEDPTFDATAIATNPKAQVRPVHRPPRTPADREPHCAWTVIIDEVAPPVDRAPPYFVVGPHPRGRARAGPPIDPAGDGRTDYAGPLRRRPRLLRVLAVGAGPDRR